jgi:hypothetical protein
MEEMEETQSLPEPETQSIYQSSVTETESDEFNDNQSIFSDSLSISNRSVKKSERKLLMALQKLKQENITLRENLESARANDVTILKTKLRGANADIVRLKTNNSELKDRVQILEEKLFKALSISATEIDEGGTAKLSATEKLRLRAQKLHQPPTNADTTNEKNAPSINTNESVPIYVKEEPGTMNQASDVTAQFSETYLHLVQRCKHLEKLQRAYEKRMSIMQVRAMLCTCVDYSNYIVLL